MVKKLEKVEKKDVKYFVSDPEKADRSFDLGSVGTVHLLSGAFETEVSKEQAEALKAYSYLVISEK